MRFLYALMLALLFALPSARADDSVNDGTRINLSATAETTLPNDEAIISFRVERQGANAGKIRQQVNRITAAIKQRLEKEANVRLTTTSRNLQPLWKYPKNAPRVRTGWNMVQTGQAVSADLAAVPTWLDAIEATGAHLSGLQFRLSRGATLKAREQLRLDAVSLFRKKAATIARGLSAESFRILRLNTNSNAPRPKMYQG